MADLYTIPQTITIGRAATFLSFNYEGESVLWNQRVISKDDTAMIALITDILGWQYETSPTDPTLRGVANYALWVYGYFQLQAQNLTGGGSVIPVTPPTNAPQPLEFVVDNTTPIPTSATSVVLPQFIGFNIAFDRNGLPQTQLSSQPTFFKWNKVTGLFTINIAAADTELFSINPV